MDVLGLESGPPPAVNQPTSTSVEQQALSMALQTFYPPDSPDTPQDAWFAKALTSLFAEHKSGVILFTNVHGPKKICCFASASATLTACRNAEKKKKLYMRVKGTRSPTPMVVLVEVAAAAAKECKANSVTCVSRMEDGNFIASVMQLRGGA